MVYCTSSWCIAHHLGVLHIILVFCTIWGIAHHLVYCTSSILPLFSCQQALHTSKAPAMKHHPIPRLCCWQSPSLIGLFSCVPCPKYINIYLTKFAPSVSSAYSHMIECHSAKYPESAIGLQANMSHCKPRTKVGSDCSGVLVLLK